ncbi:MAG: PA domain-containing protein [Crocinitomicaceae bacterium]
MKQILLSFCLIGSSFVGISQVIFSVTSPASLTGTRELTYAKPADGWGTPDLMNPANKVIDTLVFVSDGTVKDSLGCTSLTNAAELNGRIAVVYRGDCEFGMKAFMAYQAGARAVVIINNIPGSPIEMAPGANGVSALIPVVMITSAAGAALRDSILTKKVVAFIGNKQNFFTDDIGINDSSIVRSKSSSNIDLVTQNSTEYSITPGSWVTASGSNAGIGATLNCTIKFGGSEIYNETSTPITIPSGDSIYIGLPIFSQSTYPVGKYTMTYSSQMSAQDLDTSDNKITTYFYIDKHIFGYSQFNNNMTPKAGSFYRPSDANAPTDVTTNFQTCIYFADPHASRLALTGINFSANTKDSTTALTGEYLEIYALAWNDVFTDLNTATFTNIAVAQQADYTYNGDYKDSNIFVPFYPFALVDNQRYLVCVNTSSANVYLGYDAKTDYTQNFGYEEKQFLYPIQVTTTTQAAKWYGLGFGAKHVPAMSLNMIDAATLGINENKNNVSITPYPNPAVSTISIPVNNLKGDATLTIVDLSGKVIRNEKVNLDGSMLKVDVSALASGSYVFNMNFENGKTAQFRVAVNK